MSTNESNQDHPPSRYERVKQILTAAAAGSKADYQGLGNFWDLPYEEFLAVEIYGVRMIAPGLPGALTVPTSTNQRQILPAKKGCCPAGIAAASAAAPTDPPSIPWPGQPKRSARSGLIKGLKAEFPFDGSHFPRLPWGGTEVSGADIHFIAAWIDNGCPQADGEAPDQSGTGESGETCPHAGHGGSGGSSDGGDSQPGRVEPANHFHHGQDQPKVRKNYEFLSPLEIEELKAAVFALKQLDRFPADNRSFRAWGRVHGDHCQHGWEQFLPWHRAYLYKFELALQRVIPSVTLPYWDWPMATYQGGAIPEGRESGIVPTAMRCFLDDDALGNLRDGNEVPSRVLRRLGTIENQRFNSTWELFRLAGLSAADYHDFKRPIVAQLERKNPLWHPLRYPGMFYPTDSNGDPVRDGDGNPTPIRAGNQALQRFHHHYPRREDVEQILGITNWPDFGGGHFANQSFGILEQNPHNTGHIWVGGQNPFWNHQHKNDPDEPRFGDMFNDLTAFYDPVGYAHHANIDRLFWQWQKLHPGLAPDDETAEMVPFDLRVSQVLDVSKLGYEYVRDSSAHRTDPGQEIRQWSSGAAEFAEGAFQEGTKVEARFHGLRRAVRSYTVRVFLNQPGADASTPTAGNEHYAGHFARFGHGECVGGQGHCEPPGAPVSRFEIQPRHHNTPHNHRLDVTDCAARLLAKGEKDLSVDLVVVDGNGGTAEGLRMEGVSLHLLD